MTELVLTLKRAKLGVARVFEVLVRIILSLLLLALVGAMGRGIYTVVYRLFTAAGDPHEIMKPLIVDALTLLAVLEVYKTTQTYFTVGRVKVTYTLDTVLVVLLTEALVFWFGDAPPAKLLTIVGLILSLLIARLLAIQSSPDA